MLDETRMAAIADRLRAKAYTRHGEAYRWLRQHYADMLQLLSDHQPSWTSVAMVLGAEGITGAQGRPLTGESLRRVWCRVCRDMGAVPAPRPNGSADENLHGDARGRQEELPA